MPLKNDSKAVSEVRELIDYSLSRGYRILEVQATMGDMLSITDDNSINYFHGYTFRIGQRIAIICE